MKRKVYLPIAALAIALVLTFGINIPAFADCGSASQYLTANDYQTGFVHVSTSFYISTSNVAEVYASFFVYRNNVSEGESSTNQYADGYNPNGGGTFVDNTYAHGNTYLNAASYGGTGGNFFTAINVTNFDFNPTNAGNYCNEGPQDPSNTIYQP